MSNQISPEPMTSDRRVPSSAEESILGATLDLLREGGNRAVTVDSIAQRAGVSKATIYRAWRSRGELVLAAARHFMQPVTVEVEDLGSLHKELDYLFSLRLAQFAQPGFASIQAAVIGSTAEDETIREHFLEWVMSQKAVNKKILQRAVARGELPQGLDHDGLTTLLAAPLMFRAVFEGRVPDKHLADVVLQLFSTLATSSETAR